jgi:hypothetical protein
VLLSHGGITESFAAEQFGLDWDIPFDYMLSRINSRMDRLNDIRGFAFYN